MLQFYLLTLGLSRKHDNQILRWVQPTAALSSWRSSCGYGILVVVAVSITITLAVSVLIGFLSTAV